MNSDQYATDLLAHLLACTGLRLWLRRTHPA